MKTVQCNIPLPTCTTDHPFFLIVCDYDNGFMKYYS